MRDSRSLLTVNIETGHGRWHSNTILSRVRARVGREMESGCPELWTYAKRQLERRDKRASLLKRKAEEVLAYLDFAHLANTEVAAVAKKVIAEYYAKPAAYSYFVGCSTGTRRMTLS